jgi:hypothetical protein
MKTADERQLPSTPAVEYTQRQASRQAEVRERWRQERWAGYVRLATFLTVAAAVYAILTTGPYAVTYLVLAVAAFAGAVVWHRRVVQALQRAGRAAGYYGRALARLDDRWPGTGPSGERYSRPEHPYAKDLDVFGRGSVFQLLCGARTRMGQDTLARWLLEPADAATVRARQAAVEELRGELDLREELATIDPPGQSEHGPLSLVAWTAMPPVLTDRVRPALAVLLAAASVAALVGWGFFETGLAPFLVVAVFQGMLLRQLRPQMREVTRHLDSALGELHLLLHALRIMEARHFTSPLLEQVRGRLHLETSRPSARVARLARLVDSGDTLRRNMFVAPFAFVLMLVVHVAYRIEAWRIGQKRLVGDWLDAVGEFEALCSLSAYAYEHPEQPFPEILDAGPCLSAKALGHPLIPARRRVTNDLTVSEERRLLLVSGSNMSGKSTLLRTAGLNAVLALAGAPVCAAEMRVSGLAIGSAMRTADSLQEGVSGFYAEIQRLRAICDLAAGPLPVLFLLDEILHGTNSHDRRIGAEAVIRDLLAKGAIGLITTHDLALAEIAEGSGLPAANVHFEDQLADGRISFDYRLRPGTVPRGNGLALMRLLGFEV